MQACASAAEFRVPADDGAIGNGGKRCSKGADKRTLPLFALTLTLCFSVNVAYSQMLIEIVLNVIT